MHGNQTTLPWHRIDTVLLDMDGTLLDLNFDNHFWLEFVPRRYARRHGLTLAEAKARLLPLFDALKGKLEWYCLDYWSRELQLDLTSLKAEVAGLIRVFPHVTGFLEAARGAGKSLWLVTNAHPDALALKLERTCLRAFFDYIVCSHHYGKPKEDLRFWERLHRELPLVPERALMVDDSVTVLAAAGQFGIAHLVAVTRPDSRLPPRVINDFLAVEDLNALLPIEATENA
ncbi:MAG TPA: GMP/IMP nucleotidase [Methylothermaceae bacterium]|nr:GMP/IMP nucleotidase [Methylothermaceae bacterium]